MSAFEAKDQLAQLTISAAAVKCILSYECGSHARSLVSIKGFHYDNDTVGSGTVISTVLSEE